MSHDGNAPSHGYVRVGKRNKPWVLGRLLDGQPDEGLIIFFRAAFRMEKVCALLERFDYPTNTISGQYHPATGKPVSAPGTRGPRSILVSEDGLLSGTKGSIDSITSIISRISWNCSTLVHYEVASGPDRYNEILECVQDFFPVSKVITLVSIGETPSMRRLSGAIGNSIRQVRVPDRPEGEDRIGRLIDLDECSDRFHMVRFKLELGERDGVDLFDMFNLIGKLARCRDGAIGDIEIRENETEFQIHRDHALVFARMDRLRFKMRWGCLHIMPLADGNQGSL